MKRNESRQAYNVSMILGSNKDLNIRIPRSNCRIFDESLLISLFTFQDLNDIDVEEESARE
jgi:hypothetical protein